MLGVIERHEQQEALDKISHKDTPTTADLLNILESRNQTELLREISQNKTLMKGEKGDVPQKGVDYLTSDEIAEITNLIKESVKEEVRPIKGVDYFDGAKGEQGAPSFIAGPQGEKGDTPIAGIHFPMPKDGKNVSKAEARALFKELLKELEASDFGAVTEEEVREILKKHSTASNNKLAQDLANLKGDVMRNYGGHGGSGSAGSPAMLYDLSSQLNGVAKSFTIPANTAISLVTGSSAPFIFAPTTDYTGSGTTTLTFTANVDAPSALATGQTLLVQYY